MPAPHAATIATLTATGVSRELGGRLVLADVSVVVGPETRLGIVGPNGVGKSTLLRLLAGHDRPDAGRVDLSPATATIGYLSQVPDRRPGEPVRAHLHRRTGVADADLALQAAAGALAGGGPGVEDAYADALERWQALGAADLDARIDAVLAELGLPADLAGRPADALSGGQAARVGLAAVLLSRFDITLLDEPTNDLDFDGLHRLERFVGSRRGGMVVVSHDRAFLEETVSSVLEIDDHDRTGRLFRGGWAAFLDQRATARRHAEEDFADYRAKRQSLLDRARREREWATSGAAKEKRRPRDADKAQQGFRMNRTEKLASRARQTERALQRLDPVEKPWEGWDLRFTIGEAPRSGAVVGRLEQAVVARGGVVVGPFDLEVAWGDRLVLAGPNGSGKTTLIGALLGRLPLQSGGRWIGPSVKVGELGQDRGAFDGDVTVLGAFTAATGLATSEARSLLAKFGLGPEQATRPARSLSPGERTRAELAGFQARGINFLVLDEPTNHLDLPAVEQLEEALATYSGTLLVVSHDRQFLAALDVSRTVQLG